jgi:hypothetical protein
MTMRNDRQAYMALAKEAKRQAAIEAAKGLYRSPLVQRLDSLTFEERLRMQVACDYLATERVWS